MNTIHAGAALRPARGVARIFAAAAVLVAATSCGGGGDSAPPPPPPPAVQITNVTPARFDADVNVGEQPLLRLSGTLTGDLSLLNGRTIFIIIEDANGLFLHAGTSVSVTGTTGEITLMAPATTTPGVSSGTLRVFVCFDIQCNTRFGNTPVSVPYRVTVHPGLAVPATVTVSAPFGVEPAPVDVPITLPFGVTDVKVTPRGFTPWMVVQVFTGTTPVLRVSGLMQPVGSHPSQWQIDVTTQAGAAFTQSQLVTVDYTVTASSNPVALAPSRLDLMTSLAAPSTFQGRIVEAFAGAGAGTITGARVVVDNPAVPQGGDPFAPYASWLIYRTGATSSVETDPCTANAPRHCMQPGSYAARLLFSLDSGGVITEYPLPITLTVTP